MKVIPYCNKKLIFFTKSASVTMVLNFMYIKKWSPEGSEMEKTDSYMVSDGNSGGERIYYFPPMRFTAAFRASVRNKQHFQIPPKTKICYRYDSISLSKFQVLII